MSATYKIAGVQMDVQIAEVETNVDHMEKALQSTAQAGAKLTVFPECATTGYCFDSLEEAMEVAEESAGPTSKRLSQICTDLRQHVVYGFLERLGTTLYNSLNLVGPEGLVGTYRKIHLPYLGVDRFTAVGDRFSVFDIGWIRIGMHICYDGSFPESGRCLALRGADLLVLPTNWPPGSLCAADVIPNARAMENHTYFMSVNRIGTERDFEFIGKSKICNPDGVDMVFENHQSESIFYADIDPSVARQKKLVRVPGKHEIDRFRDRHPEKYGTITSPRPHLPGSRTK